MTCKAAKRRKMMNAACKRCIAALEISPADTMFRKAYALGFKAGRKYERRQYEIVPQDKKP